MGTNSDGSPTGSPTLTTFAWSISPALRRLAYSLLKCICHQLIAALRAAVAVGHPEPLRDLVDHTCFDAHVHEEGRDCSQENDILLPLLLRRATLHHVKCLSELIHDVRVDISTYRQSAGTIVSVLCKLWRRGGAGLAVRAVRRRTHLHRRANP